MASKPRKLKLFLIEEAEYNSDDEEITEIYESGELQIQNFKSGDIYYKIF